MTMAVVLDQAGGDRNADNHFVVINGRDDLAAFPDDLLYDLCEHVRREYAPSEHQPAELVLAQGGGAQAMNVDYWPYTPVSDHIAFEAPEVRVPAVGLAVPSLHVIHTNQDTVDRLDPTWMKRSALMTLAPALYVANAGPEQARAIAELVFRRAAVRLAEARDPQAQLAIERRRLESVRALAADVAVDGFEVRLAAIAKELGR
jgi:hypothetical protein